MSDATAEYFNQQEAVSKQNRLRAVAVHVRNDLHLKTLLLKVDKNERELAYERIKPFLQFKPLNYKRLMRLSPLNRKNWN